MSCTSTIKNWRAHSAALVLANLFWAAQAQAWGPHDTITQAALDVLGTNDTLIRQLGQEAQRLTNYVWMEDYFGVIMEESRDVFYGDDYLLFPAAPKYFDHTGPEVRGTFNPFYWRAVQALRTENSANAARWLGALLHFVQDAGCPPHAANLRGDVHSKMENWIETEQIRIRDYPTRPMGATAEEVFAELSRRLERLILQAEERGRRLRITVEIGNRTAVRPVVLESALECAQLTADLLHALGPIIQKQTPGGLLRGTVSSRAPVGMERFPAKVMLEGTMYSTLADLRGDFEFRNLPAGNYTVVAYRLGNGVARTNVSVKPGPASTCAIALPESTANLMPNGDFKLAWVRPTAPDYWYQTKSGWDGQPVLLKSGQRYRLVADFKEGAKSSVIVRWMHGYEHALPRYKIEPRFKTQTLTPKDREMTLTGGPDCGLLHLMIRGRQLPTAALGSIRLEAIPERN